VADTRPPASSPFVEATRPSATTTVAPAPSDTRTVAPAEATAAPFPSGYRISIPRLDIDLPIAEGEVRRDVEELRTPEGFAFHLPGTALPSETGNMYFYAHARRGMFLSLWEARRGDLVVISGPAPGWRCMISRGHAARLGDRRVLHAPDRLAAADLADPDRAVPSDPRFVVVALPRDR
jgi:hypothetical protein